MIRSLKRLWRKEDGTSSVEFCLVFPFIIYFFGLGAEIGMYQLQQVMFERGVDRVVRDLRLGKPELQDPTALVQAICDETLVVASCADEMNLDMEIVQVSDYRMSGDEITCVNRTETAKPVINMIPGAGNDVMIMRFCLLIDPVFASWGLGAILPRVEGGGIPLYAHTFFVNEP